jgi:heme/copper-type cytochrome/quinol oxidase subunit 2
MEVCGRYHHWMPLLLNVAHVDVFAAWLAANE